MDKTTNKAAKTPGGASKNKGASSVLRAAYGAVASATGSGGAPTAFKSSRGSGYRAKLKTQESKAAKDVNGTAAAAATLAALSKTFNFKTLVKQKENKNNIEMEYEEQHQPPTVPTREIALIPSGETATVASIDKDDEEEDLSPSKVLEREEMKDDKETEFEEQQQQNPIDSMGEIALPTSSGSTADVGDEDLPPSKISPMETNDMTKKRKRQDKTPSQREAVEIEEKDLKRAKNLASKSTSPSTAPTSLLEDPGLKEIVSEEKDVLKDSVANIASKEEVEKQPAELGDLRKAEETLVVTEKELEQGIDTPKADLEQSVIELQRTQSEADAEKEQENKKKEEIEARNADVQSELEQERSRSDEMTQKIKLRAAEAMANIQEEIERLKRDVLNQQTELLAKERDIATLREELLANKQTKEALDSSVRKTMELQAQLQHQKEIEARFRQSVEENNAKLFNERLNQEKERLEKELRDTAAAQIAATQIAHKSQEESERLIREELERRTKELQEIQIKTKEEIEILKHEKLSLIMMIRDNVRQQEILEKEKNNDMKMELYGATATPTPIISEVPSHQSLVVSEVSDAMGTIQNDVTTKNKMFIDDVTKSIDNLQKEISSNNQELATNQHSSLESGISQFRELVNRSLTNSVGIQNDIIAEIQSKAVINQDTFSNALAVIKRLENHIVEGDMDHDGPSDTTKIRLAWNLIKQSLINIINTAHREINNLRMAVKKSSTIRDKGYVESAKKAAERAFSLLVHNKDLDNVLDQLDIRVKIFSSEGATTFINPENINPEDLDVKVDSAENNSIDDDLKTIKTKMSMASATYKDIETTLSSVRVIAVQFANTERQSLQEIETNKIVANLEDLTATKLYNELERFSLFAKTIEDVELFLQVMRENLPLLKVFKDVIPFIVSKTDNRWIMEFLGKKGYYSIRTHMDNPIDSFTSNIMGLNLTDDSHRERSKMDENVFISTVTGILGTISEAIQLINNKIDERRSRQYLKDNLQDKRDLIAPQGQPTHMSLDDEIKEAEEKQAITLPTPSSQDIAIFTKSIFENIRAQLQKEQQEREHENMEQVHQNEKEQEQTSRKEMPQQQQQQQQKQEEDQPPPPSPFSSSPTPSRGVVGNGKGTSGERRDRNISSFSFMEITRDGQQEREQENMKEARQREMEQTATEYQQIEEMQLKERLADALTRATEAVKLNKTRENAYEGVRSIKMFLKPEEDPGKDFVEVQLSSTDTSRNIDTKGLKKALPVIPSDKIKKASPLLKKKREAASKNNTLTGKIFLDTLKDKVFPYSSKSALEDNDEGGPAVLHHPEYFRSSFSKHFIRDSTSFTEPPTFAEKSESVRNFTRLLEYSLFNDTARGARSDNDMLSRLIYVVFEHDAKMIRYLSDITYKFREYASGRKESGDGVSSIKLNGHRGNLLEATIATVFSLALPVVSSMAPRIAEAVSQPVHDDVRIRSTYSLLSLIEKFIFCASKRLHILKNVLEKSGLVNRLSLHPADANADSISSYDVQYDYSLLQMLLELMTINITNLVDAGIRPLKAVVLSIGTFTGADKTRETDRAFIPIDESRSVLSSMNTDNDIDVPMAISVVNYLSAVTDWYVTNRFSGDSADDKESLNEAVDLMHTLLMDNLGDDTLADELKTKRTDLNPSVIVEYVSKTAVPKLKTKLEEIVKKTKSNDAILVKGASEVGSLGETAVNVSLGVSREHLALPWLEVDFRGGVDDSTLLWVLSGGVNSDEVVRDYQLAVPLYSSYSSIRRRSAAPLHVKPLIRVINNTSGSDNVFLTTKTPGKEGGGGDRVHVVNLTKNVSCVLEYSTKDRYEAIINKMYRDGLVLVKGDAEVPRVFPTLDGKWMDNSRDNRTFTPLSVSRWKIPSASLVYGMLSKKKTKEEDRNQEDEEKKNKTNTSAPSVINFMGGRAGDVLLKMLTLPSEQPIIATTDSSSFDASSANNGLWKTNKDGYTSIDAQSMMARLVSDDKRPINNARMAAAASSPSSMAMVPYSDAANVVVNDPLEVYNSNNSWWIRGIQPSMRRDAAALSAVQEHLYFVQTPIF
nr:MAG: wsv143-like protein [Hemigrapsus takanoi nimavirus]